MIELILLGGILIPASIIGVAADKISEQDREVPKLANQGNSPEDTAAVRALSLKKMISQKSLLKKDIKEHRKKRAGNAQKRQEGGACMYQFCNDASDCCTEYPLCEYMYTPIDEQDPLLCQKSVDTCEKKPCSDGSDCCAMSPDCKDNGKCGIIIWWASHLLNEMLGEIVYPPARCNSNFIDYFFICT